MSDPLNPAQLIVEEEKRMRGAKIRPRLENAEVDLGSRLQHWRGTLYRCRQVHPDQCPKTCDD
jgi:hypothetical protein